MNNRIRWSLGWATIVVATAATGCVGWEADEAVGEDEVVSETEALTGVWTPLRFANSDNRLWTGPYGETYPNGDWAVNEYKAECGPKGANQLTTMVGISYNMGPEACPPWPLSVFGCYRLVQNDVVLCSNSTMSVDQYFVSRVSAGVGQSNQRDDTWGDWAYGYTKLECLPGQAVTGVGGRNILCSRVSNYKSPPTGCYVRWFNGQESRPSPNRGDWAPNSYKGECRIGEYIKGVAMDTIDTVNAILCCTPGR